MSRVRGFDLVTLAMCIGVGIYTGNKFFTPLVVDQLQKDGNLRSDIPVPEFDADGNRKDVQRELESLKEKLQETKSQ
ncbi:Ecm19 protein [Saccharomycopsis crataegensis]|uniref:Ecm19 protein n=1 Tax=Saccharomycopsis crataegensis TaxID=43959 RepID=A0AAV5QK06_9ASCO|nr:Ecm19 protein [Saccharomycopsis crataegensis]